MILPQFDISPFLNQDEGQHFDRKSMFEGPVGEKRARNRRAVRDQVAEYVAGFANAEGGVLILGIENDGAVTGHNLPASEVETILSVPQSRLQPKLPRGFVVEVQDHRLLVFDVPTSDAPVQVVGDGFPLRIGDQTLQVSESQIRALKLQGLAESWESRHSSLALKDLDLDLLAQARQRAGLAQWTDEEYLLKRKLADRQGSTLRLRRAAELLFARLGPDHPNAGVRVFRVIGAERLTGPEHNVEELPRIEGNLPTVFEEAGKVVSSLLRRPSRLVGSQFKPVSEYPDFSWKEALLNAIAHRDYGVEGACTEIWLFEDRMEITSPGGLLGDLTIERVLSMERVHCSRNPRIIRVLVDLGAARDQGEGIPRMFAEMADAFLPKPELAATSQNLSVTLRNTPVFTAEDRYFIARLGSEELNTEEFRALLHAHRFGQVENAHLRNFAGMDTLGASQVLRKLRDRGLLELHPAGANSFYTLPDQLRDIGGSEAPYRGEQQPDRGERPPDRREQAPDRGEQFPDREERQSSEGEVALDQLTLSAVEETTLTGLGNRPRKDKLRRFIEQLCADRWVTPSALAQVLNFHPANLTERHLSPMVQEGRLQRRYPDQPTHARQAYRATHQQQEWSFKPEDSA